MNNKNLSQTTTPIKSGDMATDARMHENIREMLEKNLAISNEIEENTKYIKKYVIFSQVFSFIKLVIIMVPILLAIFYGPRFVNYLRENPGVFFENSVFEGFIDSLTGAVSKEVGDNINNVDLNKVDLKNISK